MNVTQRIEELREIFYALQEDTGFTEYLLLKEVFQLCQTHGYYPSWFADWCSELGQAMRASEDENTYKEEGIVVYSEGIKHCTDESLRDYLESLYVDAGGVLSPERMRDNIYFNINSEIEF